LIKTPLLSHFFIASSINVSANAFSEISPTRKDILLLFPIWLEIFATIFFSSCSFGEITRTFYPELAKSFAIECPIP
jgi:hypothetical protein